MAARWHGRKRRATAASAPQELPGLQREKRCWRRAAAPSSGNHSGTGAGRPVILAAAGQVASEDWRVQLLGTASELASAGVVTAQVGKAWPQSPVTLQPCGTPFDTVWIKTEKDLYRYGVLVSGTDTETVAPLVLSAGNPGGQLVTSFLVVVDSRVPSPNQMWSTWFGTY